MNRFPCRCRACGARRTLAQLPENMRNSCKCKGCREARAKDIEPILHCDCGGTYRVDWYRRSVEHVRVICFCDGYHWSINNGGHRRGSTDCYYKKSPETPSEDMLKMQDNQDFF